MIKVMNCAQVDRTLIYKTFTEGFSDYMIKIEQTEDEFYHYFFGREGNALDHSYLAMDEAGRGLGVVLGGIRNFDGKLSMRCGALCVIPSMRGTQVAKDLMAAHMEKAHIMGCEQLILEVINGNDRAVALYGKLGYKLRGNLWYYQLDEVDKLESLRYCTLPQTDEGLEIITISFEELAAYRNTHTSTHLNWQNEMESLGHLSGHHYGLKVHNRIVGAITHTKSSVQFIAIDEAYRHKGYAKILFGHILNQDPTLKVLRSSSPDNESFEGLMGGLGFVKDKLSQYEMGLPLTSEETPSCFESEGK